MPLGSKLQAIRSLFAQHRNPVDAKPKTDILQPNPTAGDASMATVLNPSTLTVNPTHAPTVTITDTNAAVGVGTYANYVLGTNNTTNLGALGGGSHSNVQPAYQPYYQYGTSIMPNQSQGWQWNVTNWPQSTGQVLYNLDSDSFTITNPLPSRSEFTEEEIEQAEQLMAELGG